MSLLLTMAEKYRTQRGWASHLLGILATDVPIEKPISAISTIGSDTTSSCPPLLLFMPETTAQKARLMEDAWNIRDPACVALAYTADSRWRNRTKFIKGREAIEAFLARKWQHKITAA